MQFTCNQDTFAKYLNILSRIVSSKPGLPILNNILFETGNGKLLMTATDLELGIHCWIGAEVKVDGKIAVPGKILSEFVNSIPDDKIEALLDNQLLSLRTGNNFAEFNTTLPDDFPSVAGIKSQEPLLRFAKIDIMEAVSKVAFATAKDDVKPVMTGIKLEMSDNIVAFVATDSLRLSRYVIKLNAPVSQPLELLIPARAFEELARIISDIDSSENDDYVSLYLIEDKNQVLFRYNDVDLVTRLIDGQFPDYKAIIPTSYQCRVEFDRVSFQNSLKITNTIAKNAVGNKTILKISNAEQSLSMSASQAEVGKNISTMDIKSEGTDMDLAFSSRFLNDLLTNIGADDIVFECSSSVSPGVFKIKDQNNYIHLVMPMRL